MVGKTAGVLALQGDFAEHLELLEHCGRRSRPVSCRDDLDRIDALIIPGGESTTILKMMERLDMRDHLIKLAEAGLPIFGTCAGAICLARSASETARPLGLIDARLHRNAYGRQAQSFETEIDAPFLGAKIRGAFIRAPIIEHAGKGVEVLASYQDHPVLIRSDKVLAATFHPEIAGETSVHEYFFERVCA